MGRDVCISTAVCITEVGLFCLEHVMIINNKLCTSTCDERYEACISVFCRVNDKQNYWNQSRKVNCPGRRKYYSAFIDTDTVFYQNFKRVATFPWSGIKIVNYELEIILVFHLRVVMCAAVWLGELHRETLDYTLLGDNISRHRNEIDSDIVNLTLKFIPWLASFLFWC
jgi:hypothetical protein